MKNRDDIIIESLNKLNGFDLVIFYLKIDKGLSYKKMENYLALSYNALFKRMTKIYKMIKVELNEHKG